MSYNVQFKLKVYKKETGRKVKLQSIKKKLHGKAEKLFKPYDEYAISTIIEEGYENFTWYEYKEEMQKLSKEFEEYVFVLSGQGEEAGDIWICEFYKGEVDKWEPKLVKKAKWLQGRRFKL